MSLSQEYPRPRIEKYSTIARVTDDWYIVSESRKLHTKPLAVTLLGMPLVVFRMRDSQVMAMLDSCPHRNAPLSLGSVLGETLQCSYHGWEFDRRGECRRIPGLTGGVTTKAHSVPVYPTREEQGFIWVYATPDAEPAREPFRFPLIGERGYTTVSRQLEVEASLHAAAENILDVPHTAYLHGGLFRTSKGARHEIEVLIKGGHERVEAEYVGEARPSGMIGRIVAPRGGEVKHTDRFILPSIAQVEYRLGNETHLCVTSALTPTHGFQTKLYTVVSIRLPVPGWVVAPAIRPIMMRIFKQDAFVLRHQTETLRRFGGERFASTEIDILGSHILRLLRRAERGQREKPGKLPERRVRMMV